MGKARGGLAVKVGGSTDGILAFVAASDVPLTSKEIITKFGGIHRRNVFKHLRKCVKAGWLKTTPAIVGGRPVMLFETTD